MTVPERDLIIRMAWEDRTTFEEIREKIGFSETAVIKLMRHELKPSSFRMSRKRVSCRVTKPRRIFKAKVLRAGEYPETQGNFSDVASF